MLFRVNVSNGNTEKSYHHETYWQTSGPSSFCDSPPVEVEESSYLNHNHLCSSYLFIKQTPQTLTYLAFDL